MEMEFLPSWPPAINDFILFGLLLAAGLLGGNLASRTTFLPRITGYILAGFLFGPGALGLLSPELLQNARPFTDIALGLILFELGRVVDLSELRQNPLLVIAGIAESLLTFVLIFGLLWSLGVPPLGAVLAAALGVSSSPAVILLVIRQLGANGPVTRQSLRLVAINNVIAFGIFLVTLPALHFEQQAKLTTILLQPLYQFGGSLGLALGLASLYVYAARHLERRDAVQFALTVGVIIAALGLAKLLNVSPLLTLLSLGVLSRNLDHGKVIKDVEFGHGGQLFFLILFVVAGANLHVREVMLAGFAAFVFVAARLLAKSGATYFVMRMAGMTPVQAGMIGLTLTPMAGMAIGLAQVTYDLYPQYGRELNNIMLAAVAILETIGPVLTEFALKRAGEVPPTSSVAH